MVNMAVQEERKYAIEAVLLEIRERNPRKKSEKEIRERNPRRVFCL